MAGIPMKIPIFSRGSVDQLEKALTVGVFKSIDRVIWHYVTEGDHAGSLILVYADKTLHYISDTNLSQTVADLSEVVNTNTVDIEDIKLSISAIEEQLENYVSQTETLKNSVSTIISDLTAYSNRLDALDTKVEENTQNIASVGEVVVTLTDTVTEHGTAINAQADEIANLSNTVQDQEEELSTLSEKMDISELGDKTITQYIDEKNNELKDYIDSENSVDFI